MIRPVLFSLLLFIAASPARGQAPLEHIVFPSIVSVDEPDRVVLFDARRDRAKYVGTDLPLVFEQQPGPRWHRIAVGAGAGALIGGAVFLLQSDGCWQEADSMCELAIPLYIGGGAAVGGLVGFVFAKESPQGGRGHRSRRERNR